MREVEEALSKMSPRIFTYVMYLPRRSAVHNHMKSYPSLGVISKVMNYHHLYIDFDNRNTIENVLNVYEILCSTEIPSVILRTRKGYHIRAYFPFTWKDVMHILTKIKPMIDIKWLNLQRKRGLIIIRIAGKYPRKDIIALKSCFQAEEPFKKYAILSNIVLEYVSTIFHITPWEKINAYFEKVVRGGERVWFK